MSDDGEEKIIPVVDKIVPDVYNDGLKPAISETGKMVALVPQAINAALAPLRQWIAKREYNVEETKKLLELKLAKVGTEHIVPPEPYVAVPALQSISYSMDSKELRNLYANLLARSMTDTEKEKVHPSFVEIIRQLTPEEAKILKLFAQESTYPLIELRCVDQLPKIFTQKTYSVVIHNFTSIGDDICGATNISVCLENLTRLKLINIFENKAMAESNLYKSLENDPFIVDMMKQALPDNHKWEIHRKMFSVTDYGRQFIDICVNDK